MKMITTINNVDEIKPEIDYILAKSEKVLPVEEVNYSSSHYHSLTGIPEEIITKNYTVKKENCTSYSHTFTGVDTAYHGDNVNCRGTYTSHQHTTSDNFAVRIGD